MTSDDIQSSIGHLNGEEDGQRRNDKNSLINDLCTDCECDAKGTNE